MSRAMILSGNCFCALLAAVALVAMMPQSLASAQCDDTWMPEASLNMPRALLRGAGVDPAGNI